MTQTISSRAAEPVSPDHLTRQEAERLSQVRFRLAVDDGVLVASVPASWRAAAERALRDVLVRFLPSARTLILPESVELSVLPARPGDTVTVQVPAPLTADQAEALRRRVAAALPEGVSTVVLPAGARIEVTG